MNRKIDVYMFERDMVKFEPEARLRKKKIISIWKYIICTKKEKTKKKRNGEIKIANKQKQMKYNQK